MSKLILPMMAALIGGVAAGLQAPFNGIMGQKVGDLASVFITYGGGAVIIALVVLLTGNAQFSEWRTLPWYVFLAGPLGLVIIGTLGYTIPRLGAASTTTLFILSWLAIAVAIDHLGLLGVDVRRADVPRLVGIALLMAGTWLVVR